MKTLKDATVVPDDAIQHGTDGLYAYAVNQDNKAELRKLKVSYSIDGRSVVDDGLSPGQQVITAGQYKVQPGTLVSTAVASSEPAQPKVKQDMSDGISAPFIRYPIGTSLMMAGILFVGLVAYPLLPVAPLPQVDFPTIQVAASLPGGSPETMASSVAQPLERQLAQIPGIAQMTSTSYLGTTAVTIQFDLIATSTAPPTMCRLRSTPPAANCRRTFPRPRPTARSTRRIRLFCYCRRRQTPCHSPPSATPSTPSSRNRSARSPAWRR